MKKYLVIFVVALAIFALFSWNYLLHPTPNFHFIDLANSFLHGRLDTDTPKQSPYIKKKDDPPGYREAIKRVQKSGGWNDWASYHIVTLTDGTVVKGVWPWGDTNGGKKNLFRTLDGRWMVIDKTRDIKTGCGGKFKKCDEKKYFVSFPPFPAILMLPFVAIMGYNLNDVIFTLFFAAFNIAFLFFLLNYFSKIGLSKRSEKENLFLSFLFGFGTVYFFSAIRGEVWFTALIIGVTMHLLFLYTATNLKHPVLSGILIGLGFLTRTPLIFVSLYFILQLFFANGKFFGLGLKKTVITGLKFGIPVVITLIIAFIYNYARFENIFEFGHTYLMDGTRPSIREHGLFSFYFLNNNLPAVFTNFPRLTLSSPFIKITKHGLALLVTSPFLFRILRIEKPDRLIKIAAITVFITMLPGLFYQNTGWAQFSYRFALDYLPLLFLMLAIYPKSFKNRWFTFAIIVAFVLNAFGAITFGRMDFFYYD